MQPRTTKFLRFSILVKILQPTKNGEGSVLECSGVKLYFNLEQIARIDFCVTIKLINRCLKLSEEIIIFTI